MGVSKAVFLVTAAERGVKLCTSLCLGYDFRTQLVLDISIMTSLPAAAGKLASTRTTFQTFQNVLDKGKHIFPPSSLIVTI